MSSPFEVKITPVAGDMSEAAAREATARRIRAEKERRAAASVVEVEAPSESRIEEEVVRLQETLSLYSKELPKLVSLRSSMQNAELQKQRAAIKGKIEWEIDRTPFSDNEKIKTLTNKLQSLIEQMAKI